MDTSRISFSVLTDWQDSMSLCGQT